ncbi:putative T7SS-secreted protein, partial [Nocardia sp. NPDC058497]|uniref:putative T7SS-secreted protein n=1 Tax=Nocardia sp. NPDC058497 TaxID=3346529 RepID=UPI0036611E13
MGIGDFIDKVGNAIEDGVENVVERAGQVIDDGLDVVGDAAQHVGLEGIGNALDDLGDKIAAATGGEFEEEELGQTEDPKELILGEPAEIGSTAETLKKMATAVELTGQALRQIDAAEWTGKGADAFNEVYDKQPKLWFDGADAMTAAAGALEAWQNEVKTAQDKAQTAIDRWKAADSEERRKKTWWNGLTGEQQQQNPLVDTWTSIRNEAREILRGARVQRDNGASIAVGAVSAATEKAPKEPPFTQRWIANISDLGGVLEHGALNFYSGLLTSLTGLVQFVRQVNPTDIYNITHPADYAEGLSNLGTGLVVAVADPGAAVTAILKDARANPFEFAGALTGDALLTAATGGAGSAKVAASALRRLSNAGRHLPDGPSPHSPSPTRETSPTREPTPARESDQRAGLPNSEPGHSPGQERPVEASPQREAPAARTEDNDSGHSQTPQRAEPQQSERPAPTEREQPSAAAPEPRGHTPDPEPTQRADPSPSPDSNPDPDPKTSRPEPRPEAAGSQPDSTPTQRADTTPTPQSDQTPTQRADTTPTQQSDHTPTQRADTTPTQQPDHSPTQRADTTPTHQSEHTPAQRTDSAPSHNDSTPTHRAESPAQQPDSTPTQRADSSTTQQPNPAASHSDPTPSRTESDNAPAARPDHDSPRADRDSTPAPHRDADSPQTDPSTSPTQHNTDSPAPSPDTSPTRDVDTNPTAYPDTTPTALWQPGSSVHPDGTPSRPHPDPASPRTTPTNGTPDSPARPDSTSPRPHHDSNPQRATDPPRAGAAPDSSSRPGQHSPLTAGPRPDSPSRAAGDPTSRADTGRVHADSPGRTPDRGPTDPVIPHDRTPDRNPDNPKDRHPDSPTPRTPDRDPDAATHRTPDRDTPTDRSPDRDRDTASTTDRDPDSKTDRTPDPHTPTPRDRADADRDAFDEARKPGAEHDRTPDQKTCSTDPVDISTGEFLLPETDVELPAVLPLILRRSHHSNFRFGRWFGPSWSATLDARIVVSAAGATFLGEDGIMLAFPHAEPGEPVRPLTESQSWSLTRTDSGGYRVWDQRRELIWHFAPESGLDGLETQLGDYAVSAITDRHHNRIRFHYDSDGVPVEVSHSGGYRVRVDTAHGRITGLALLADRPDAGEIAVPLRNFSYAAGQLTAVTNAVAATTSYTYDPAYRMTSWTDSNGSRMVNTYDEAGRVIRQRGSGGILDSGFEYVQFPGGAGRLTAVTDSVGAVTTHGFDRELQLRDLVTPDGGHFHTDYNAQRRPLTVTGPDPATVTAYRYNDVGDPVEIIRPDGISLEYEYLWRNRPTTITTADGSVHRREWSDNGDLTAAIDPAGARTEFTYHQSGGRGGGVCGGGRGPPPAAYARLGLRPNDSTAGGAVRRQGS